MQHISIPVDGYCELLNFTPVNPLVSKCQIKVCYVQDTPNRNNSIITKETATKMAMGLPGSPIVGFFDQDKGDFDSHTREIEIKDGKLAFIDKTKPYGFVDMNAKVWFQKFLDDGIEHEYLMTEGYVWTKVYPEAQHIITHGNNQSMELDNDSVKGYWAKNDNGMPDFFIINEALISKLCVLGKDIEPCFEGARIQSTFSLDDEFKTNLFSMIQEIKEAIEKGGQPQMDEIKNNEELTVEETENEQEIDVTLVDENFEKKSDKNEQEDSSKNEEEQKGEENSDEEDEDEKKKNFELENHQNYVELETKFNALTEQVNELNKTIEDLNAELVPLREYRAAAEREKKQQMIDSFYMLSASDKQDCVTNIDAYSLDDIEAKLSIICVRNKVSFDLDEDKEEEKSNPTIYSLQDEDQNDAAPAWVKAVRDTAKNM